MPRPLRTLTEIALLMLLCFAYAGDPPPSVNEAHYLVKAKNFWNPQWCQHDLFAASGKAHVAFYLILGWPTQFCSLTSTAWIGRFVGWLSIAIGLQRLCWVLLRVPYVSIGVAVLALAGIEYANLAGEWVVGGIEAKVLAYGFVLLGLSFLVQRRWSYVWPLLGLAAAFHVLVGGWAVVAAAIAWWLSERGRSGAVPLFTRWLLLGGLLSLPGLIPSLLLTMGSTEEQSNLAAQIYCYGRLRHHLLPASFPLIWYVRHAVLLLALAIAWWLGREQMPARFRRLGSFILGILTILVLGFGVSALPAVAPNLAAKLLRFYWFRQSDALLPICLGVIVVRLALQRRQSVTVRTIAVLAMVLATGAISYSGYQRMQVGVPPSVSHRLLGWDRSASPETQRQVFSDWVAVCDWIRSSTDENDIFLTPRHQQTFKWYAERAEVVNWKDVPQDAERLTQWSDRFVDVYPRRFGRRRVTRDPTELKSMAQRYGAKYMVIDLRVRNTVPPLTRVYPKADQVNATYAVYLLPSP